MSEQCRWLHEQLEQLPLITYPFTLRQLPVNGIYAFYERGESWGHGGRRPRIVRIGTHRDGNFRNRIAEHFLLTGDKRMDFDATRPAPHARSVFRINLGRALLHRARDAYLDVWNIDFTTRRARAEHGHRRDIAKEKAVEAEITRRLREDFAFRFIIVNEQTRRMGAEGLERRLIGTLAGCAQCRPSAAWLGHASPVERIRQSGLWQVQHLGAAGLEAAHQAAVTEAIALTKEWLASLPRTTS